jgi:hypothetical protein
MPTGLTVAETAVTDGKIDVPPKDLKSGKCIEPPHPAKDEFRGNVSKLGHTNTALAREADHLSLTAA